MPSTTTTTTGLTKTSWNMLARRQNGPGLGKGLHRYSDCHNVWCGALSRLCLIGTTGEETSGRQPNAGRERRRIGTRNCYALAAPFMAIDCPEGRAGKNRCGAQCLPHSELSSKREHIRRHLAFTCLPPADNALVGNPCTRLKQTRAQTLWCVRICVRPDSTQTFRAWRATAAGRCVAPTLGAGRHIAALRM